MRFVMLAGLVLSGCGADHASPPKNYAFHSSESDSLVFSVPVPASLASHDAVPYAVRARCRTAAGMKDCLMGARLLLRPHAPLIAPQDDTIATMLAVATKTAATAFPALAAKALITDQAFAEGLGEQELVTLLKETASREVDLYHGFRDLPLGYAYQTRVREVVGKFEIRVLVKRSHADSDEVQAEEHNGTFELHGGGPLDLRLTGVECVDTYFKTTYDVAVRFMTKSGETVASYAVKDAVRPDCLADGSTHFVEMAAAP